MNSNNKRPYSALAVPLDSRNLFRERREPFVSQRSETIQHPNPISPRPITAPPQHLQSVDVLPRPDQYRTYSLPLPVSARVMPSPGRDNPRGSEDDIFTYRVGREEPVVSSGRDLRPYKSPAIGLPRHLQIQDYPRPPLAQPQSPDQFPQPSRSPDRLIKIPTASTSTGEAQSHRLPGDRRRDVITLTGSDAMDQTCYSDTTIVPPPRLRPAPDERLQLFSAALFSTSVPPLFSPPNPFSSPIPSPRLQFPSTPAPAPPPPLPPTYSAILPTRSTTHPISSPNIQEVIIVADVIQLFPKRYKPRQPRAPGSTLPPPPAKEYRCDLCAHVCGRLTDLKRHRRTHLGMRSWECEICPSKPTYSRADAYIRHCTNKGHPATQLGRDVIKKTPRRGTRNRGGNKGNAPEEAGQTSSSAASPASSSLSPLPDDLSDFPSPRRQFNARPDSSTSTETHDRTADKSVRPSQPLLTSVLTAPALPIQSRIEPIATASPFSRTFVEDLDERLTDLLPRPAPLAKIITPTPSQPSLQKPRPQARRHATQTEEEILQQDRFNRRDEREREQERISLAREEEPFQVEEREQRELALRIQREEEMFSQFQYEAHQHRYPPPLPSSSYAIHEYNEYEGNRVVQQDEQMGGLLSENEAVLQQQPQQQHYYQQQQQHHLPHQYHHIQQQQQQPFQPQLQQYYHSPQFPQQALNAPRPPPPPPQHYPPLPPQYQSSNDTHYNR